MRELTVLGGLDEEEGESVLSRRRSLFHEEAVGLMLNWPSLVPVLLWISEPMMTKGSAAVIELAKDAAEAKGCSAGKGAEASRKVVIPFW